MKKILVLGPGCAKCDKLHRNAEEAARELGLECTIEKVTDQNEILAHGVVMTPALVVDGEVKLVGKAANTRYVKELLA